MSLLPVLLLGQICLITNVIGKLGVTAIKQSHHPEFGIDYIGCRDWTDPNGMNCNPYQGDTECDRALPMLCVNVDRSPRPPYFIFGNGAAMPAANYYGWTSGHVSTTIPVKASNFQTLDQANAFCAQAFGQGWQIVSLWWGQSKWISEMNGTRFAGAEWTNNIHQLQNGGWSMYSYGNVRNDTRFWINGPWDQSSTCWTQPSQG